MVPVGLSKSDYKGLILLDPGVKINEICYYSSVTTVAVCRTSGLWQVQKQCPSVGHISFLTLIFYKIV